MKSLLVFTFFFIASDILLLSALPQYQQKGTESRANYAESTASGEVRQQRSCCSGQASNPRASAQTAPESQSSQELVAAGASFGQESFARPSSFGAFGNSGSGGSQGNNLNVQCQQREVSPGQYKFICDGVNKELITLRSEHILWLQSNGGQQQVLDIEVPNYKIDELIKAGFKTSAVGGTQINVLLRKPEQVYDAEVDIPSIEGGTPSVNLQYEPVEKTLVHFPNDKAYRPLSGPILPPLASGGRVQRQASLQFSKRVE